MLVLTLFSSFRKFMTFHMSKCHDRVSVCVLLGRPDSRMWCPYVIGREAGYGRNRTLFIKEFPPQRGGGGPDWSGSTHRGNSTGGVGL